MDRIDKILSHHGFGSRKDVKHLLRSGIITVNDKVIYDPAFQLDISVDKVVVDDEPIVLQHDLYIMMNKCKNVVCANKDGEHATVFDLIDENLRHKFLGGDLHCMGRLDIDTEGLLILTTDGKLTHRLLAPKTHIPKTYAVGLKNKISDEEKKSYTEKFSKGFWIEREQNENGFECQPSVLKWIEDSDIDQTDKINATEQSDCILTIFEGKFHQVKRMFSACGNEVIYLKRISMGNLKLDNSIAVGSYKQLSEEEIQILRNS